MKDDKILYSFTWEDGFPTLENVEEKFKLSPDDIDSEFGIVEIDEVEKLYCILISKNAIFHEDEENKGQQHSNPRIAPFNLEEE